MCAPRFTEVGRFYSQGICYKDVARLSVLCVLS